jgi:4-aminobutyrate aminotransferase
LPLSGILAQKSLMDRMPPGSHGGTYGGNVVSCAAAMATLDVIEDEGLVENARVRGRQLLDGLRRITAGRASVGDVRGLGLMVALEFVVPGEGDGRVPDPALTKRVQQACYERRLLLLTAGTYVNVIRIIPPLVTTEAEVDLALGIIAEALDAAGA